MASPVVPSKIVDSNTLSIPPEEDLVDTEGWESCGYWILASAEADLAFLDKTWNALKSLVEDGTLLMLNSTTAALISDAMVMQCFTKAGKEEAKRTAQIIRKTVDLNHIIYYRMNKMDQAGVAHPCSRKNGPIYMHTYLGRFYIRDARGEWISEENKLGDVSLSRRFLKERYSGSAKRPSVSREHFVNLKRTAIGVENWYLKCSMSETNGAYLPEADRVWIIATELFEDGHFAGISWIKNSRGVEVRLYVMENSDLSSQLSACDRILKGALVGRLMHFTRENGRHFKYTYKYTAEGELYEQTASGEKFVSQRE